MQCGAACLAMVGTSFGMPVSLRHADRLCGASKQGVSMLAISKSATELGLENATVKLTVEKLAEMPMPCIRTSGTMLCCIKYQTGGGASTSPTPAKVKCASAPMNSENIG